MLVIFKLLTVSLVPGINKMGVGVAMNNTVPATPSNASFNSANTNINNIQLDDVQKLQQQLQDIKEQVKVLKPKHILSKRISLPVVPNVIVMR